LAGSYDRRWSAVTGTYPYMSVPMIVESSNDDIVYSDLFTGVHGNYFKPSIRDLAHGTVKRKSDFAQRSRPARLSTWVTGSAKYCKGVRSSPLGYTSAGIPACSFTSPALAIDAGSISTSTT